MSATRPAGGAVLNRRTALSASLFASRSWYLLAGAAAACLLATALMWTAVLGKLDELATSQSDNIQWTLAQVEVEYLRLVTALEAAEAGTIDLATLRQRFDLFYSRLATVTEGRLYRDLGRDPGFAEAVDAARGFRDRTGASMDGPDTALREALPSLVAAATTLHPAIRALPLKGLDLAAEDSAARRTRLARLLVQVASVTLLLLGALSATILLLARANRMAAARALETATTTGRLETVVRTSLDAIVVVGGDGRIRDYNPAAEETFGMPRDAALGLPVADLLAPDAAPEGVATLAGKGRVLRSARRAGGAVFPVEIAVAAGVGADGPMYVAFLRDVSARVAAEAELRTARDDALAGERAKAEFLAVMSHEMRTPLNGLLGTMELFDTTALDAVQRRFLTTMEASGRLLLQHVNDVLDIARHDAGNVRLEEEVFDLTALIDEIVAGQAPLAAAQGNTLAAQRGAGVPRHVRGDERRLRQVLLNLLGNAVKFTRNGRVTVETARLPDGRLEFGVRDTGIGMDADRLRVIFDDFVTLDRGWNRSAGGTGLGLGIVRRLVGAMGGEVVAESAAGQGSLFRVRVDLPEAAAPVMLVPTAEGAGAAPPGPLEVLMVEDNPVNRLVLGEMLRRTGHRVTEAEDGPAGVAAAAVMRFDAILMDISMPGMDGCTAARAIRDGGGASCGAPIVAVTAHALPQDRERFRAAGMAGVLVKPVSRRALAEVLAEVLAEGRAARPRPAGAGADEDELIDGAVRAEVAQTLGPAFGGLVARVGAEIRTTLRGLAGLEPEAQVAALHRLAGSAGLIGAAAFLARIAAIETAWKADLRAPADGVAAELSALWARSEAAFEAARERPAVAPP